MLCNVSDVGLSQRRYYFQTEVELLKCESLITCVKTNVIVFGKVELTLQVCHTYNILTYSKQL